jgi:adenylosuccinate lyase
MAAIWTPENRFRIWFEIEAHACDGMAEIGVIPQAAATAIRDGGAKAMAALKNNPAGEIKKIDDIERVLKHDILAFTTWLADFIGPEARFVHQGLTSSDILDTTLAVQLTQASDLLLEGIDKVLAALKRRALEHKHTPTIGRSHGIHAEPTTFGIKLAGHYAAFARNRKRLETARAEVATCAISGPVGTFASVDPRIEEYVAKKLGFAPEPVSTQVIPRDRHAAYFAALGVIASSVENLATEIRHLQRTEVREAEEFFSEGQKGSSSMPHKRNPVLTENLTGLARVVRSAVMPALENVTLWHERDISHSSTERYIAPDATGTLDFALNRLAGVVENLAVYADRMKANLDSLGGIVFSQRVLLALTQKGMSREASYAAVQRNAMEAWRGNASLLALVRADKEIREFLADDELVALFEPGWHTRHVDMTFKRVFG